MKILVVQDCLRSGGTERQSALLANAFSAVGHRTKLLTFRPGGKLRSTVAAAVEQEALQPFDTGLDWWAPRLGAKAQSFAPDVVLCMGRMANCYAGSLQNLLPASPVIATMRTGKKLPRLYRRSLCKVRQIVTNSHEAKASLVSAYQIPSEKICVIHNALVFSKTPIAGTREDVRNQLGVVSKATLLLSVAMFRPEKGQRELIEIVAGLPPEFRWQLWFAGDGPARTACENLVRERGLAAFVKFLGWQKEPGPLYAAADIAVHASSSEALSNFLIEAQAHGVPAVAYNTQGITECFVPNSTGFAVAPGDRQAFRARIVELAQMPPEKRAERTTLAKEFSLGNFDHDRQVARYLELFEQLRR